MCVLIKCLKINDYDDDYNYYDYNYYDYNYYDYNYYFLTF